MSPDAEISCGSRISSMSCVPSRTSRAAIETSGLAIGYPQKPVGRDITLRLAEGEILCLLGPNGSGKSTLLKTLLGLLPARAGQVRVLGRPLAEWPRRELARRLGYVPQAHSGEFPFTVEEIVLMGRSSHLSRYAVPGPHDRQVAHECLATLGIEALAQEPFTQISGGERQLALIARALAQQPSILIMDEPTASLDFGNQLRVLEKIRKLKQEGLAILLCTHQPEHAARLADRVALFRDGALHATGAPQALLTAPRLAWLYGLEEAELRAWSPMF